MSFCPTKIHFVHVLPGAKNLALPPSSYLGWPQRVSKTRNSFSLMDLLKKLRGRPQLKEGKRTRKVDVRFTEKELELVNKMAEALGVTRAELARSRILGGAEAIVINALSLINELDEIGAEFGRAGNNINQLAKYSNILRNKNILSPIVAEHFLIYLEHYSKNQQRIEGLLRKIIRQLNCMAI